MRKDSNNHQKIKLIIFLFIIVFLFSIKYLGFPIQDNNETAPAMYRIIDSDYLKNDWFVNANDNINVRTIFNYTLITSNYLFKNFEVTNFILFVSISTLMMYFIFKLSKLLTKSENTSYFISFLLVFGLSFTLGGNALLKYTLTPTSIGWLFGIIGIYFFFKNKMAKSSLFLGIATAYQLLIGLQNFLILLTAFTIKNIKKLKENFKNYALMIIPYSIVSIVTILPVLLVQLTNSAKNSSQLIIDILVYRAPHHYLPSSWKLSIYLYFLTFFILFIIAFKKSRINQEYKQTVKLIFIFTIVLFILGTIFVEIFPISIFTKMQFFRSCVLLLLFEYIFIGEFIFNMIKKSSGIEKIFYLFFPISFLYRPIALVYIFVFISILFIKHLIKFDIFKFLNQRKRLFLIFIICGTIISIIGMFIAKNIILGIISANEGFFIPYILLPSIFYFTILPLLFNKRKIFAVMFAILIIVSFGYNFYQPFPQRGEENPHTLDMFSYIKSETSRNTILLTPPYIKSFRLGAKRAIVVDFKSNPLLETSMIEWHLRLKDVTNNQNLFSKIVKKNDLIKGYNSLDENQINNLQKKYGFSYVVFEKPKELNFTVFYQNQEFVVYEV